MVICITREVMWEDARLLEDEMEDTEEGACEHAGTKGRVGAASTVEEMTAAAA